MGFRTNGILLPKPKTSKVLWKWEFEQMGFLTTFRPSWAKWDCCSGYLIDSCFTHTRTVCLHPHISTQLSCFKHVHVMYRYQCFHSTKPTNVFENLVAWGSRRGLKLWRGSKTTREVCAGDYSLQTQFFTNNFEILLFALQTSKFAWKWVLCVWRLHC